MMQLSGIAEAIEHNAGLDVGEAGDGVERADGVHVFGEVEDNGDVTALTGEAGAGTAGEDGRSELAADCDRCYHILDIAWDHNADCNLTVIGSVCAVQSARRGIETDFAAESSCEARFELARVREALVRERHGSKDWERSIQVLTSLGT